MKVKSLVKRLDDVGFEYQLNTPLDIDLIGVSVFPAGEPYTLSMWRKNHIPMKEIRPNEGNVLLCTLETSSEFASAGFHTIVVKDPRAAFAVMASSFMRAETIDTRSNPISEMAHIGEGTQIGHNVVLGEVSIGSNCEIGNNVVIKSGTAIGNNVEIGDNTTIGGVGFGYVDLPDGSTFQVPHLGGVEIADGVHIGSNTCIDRGSIGNTVIGENSRIDNLVHIAHNVQIGKGVFVIAGAEISGSVKIGDKAWIAPNACVREGLTIGASAVVGLGSVVVKDVAEGTTVMGVPARPRD